MATPGGNLEFAYPEKVWNRIKKKLGIPVDGSMVGAVPGVDGTLTYRVIAIGQKATGAPANNTALDAPTGYGDLCWDSTNKQLYRCTAYTSPTVFTWTLIAA